MSTNKGGCTAGAGNESYQTNQAGKQLDYICSIHPEETISIYVKESKKLICSECIFDQDLMVNKNNSIKVRQKDIQENVIYHVKTLESFIAKAQDNLNNLKSIQNKQALVDSDSIQNQITENCKMLTHGHITDQEQITQLTKFASSNTNPQDQAQQSEVNTSESNKIPKKTAPNIFNSHQFEADQQELKMSQNKFEVSFNDPGESQNIDCKINIIGQNNTELVTEGEKFKSKNTKDSDSDRETFDSYFEVNASMQPNQKAKYEKLIQILQKVADEESGDKLLIKFDTTDKMISAKILIKNRYRFLVDDFHKKLDKFRTKGLDQHVHLKFGAGNFFQELPKSHEKPFLEHLINSGFWLSLDVQFQQEIKELLMEMAGELIRASDVFKFFLPAFNMNSDTNIKLQYSDIDAIRNHEQLSPLLLALEDLTQKTMNCSFTEIKKLEEINEEGFDNKKFEEYLKSDQESSAYRDMERFEFLKTGLSIAENLSEPSDIKLKGHIEGDVSIDLSINGAGLSGCLVYLWYILISERAESERQDAINSYKNN